MVLEPVRVALSRTEGPEKDDHAGQAELVPQLDDRRRDVAEVLCDHGEIA